MPPLNDSVGLLVELSDPAPDQLDSFDDGPKQQQIPDQSSATS